MSEVPHPRRPVSTTVVRNTAFGGLRVLLVAPIPLLLTPYIVHHLGTMGLGVWGVLMAFYGLTALGDVGLTGTLTKHVSEYYARREFDRLNATINAGIVIFLAMAAIVLLVVTAARLWLVSTFLSQFPLPHSQLSFGVMLVGIAMACNLLVFPFVSVLSGLQRLDITSLLSASVMAVIASVAAVGLHAGHGVLSFSYAILVGAVFNLLSSILAVSRTLREFRFSLRAHSQDLKGLFSFSLKMYVTQIAVVVHTNTEKFLLAHFSGLTSAGWYDVANDLSLKARGIPDLMLSPLLPAFSDLEATAEHDKALELYRRAHKYLAVLGGLIFFTVCFVAKPFVRVWLGSSYAAVGPALVVLAAVQFANLTSGPAMSIMIGKGKLGPGVRAALLGLVLNLTVSTVLILRYGFQGALYGTAISVLAGTTYFLILFHRETHWPAKLLAVPYATPVIWGCALVWIGLRLLPFEPKGWMQIVTSAAVFASVYLMGLVLMRYFDALDLHTLEQLPVIDKLLRRRASAAI